MSKDLHFKISIDDADGLEAAIDLQASHDEAMACAQIEADQEYHRRLCELEAGGMTRSEAQAALSTQDAGAFA